MMKALTVAIRSMIEVSDDALDSFLGLCYLKTFKPKEFLGIQGRVSDEVFFINRGITRSLVVDHFGEEHTIHFSLEHQFICDYTSFITRVPAINSIQALEETEVVVMPRKAIDWGYQNFQQGDRMGRLIAEYYFIYFDQRLKNQYVLTPTERYATMANVFPNIHNRVPQHMIASYLGISPIHLSRLKKRERK